MIASLDVNALLAERSKVHGDFTDQAAVTQAMKDVLRAAPRWSDMTPFEKETAEMTVHKLARAVCGDPHEPDHYADIAGYNTLCANRCRDRRSEEEELRDQIETVTGQIRADGTGHPDVNKRRGSNGTDASKG